jgi:hypothetical protein
VPLRTTAALAGEALDLLRKYGLSGMAGVLLRSECIEAIELLNKVRPLDQCTCLPVDAHAPLCAVHNILIWPKLVNSHAVDLDGVGVGCGPGVAYECPPAQRRHVLPPR